MNSREAQDAAWKAYRKELGDTSNWTVSESATYRGFFNHGFHAAIQHARDVAVKACKAQSNRSPNLDDAYYNVACNDCAAAIKEALK